MLKISIVIPAKDRPGDLKACFDSLAKQLYKNFEVIVVDGSVSTAVRGVCNDYGKFLDIKYIPQKKKGIVGAIQDGFEQVSGDIFTRTDDDVVASPEWLNEIIKAFQASDQIGGVTGPTLIPEDKLEARDLIKFHLKLKDSKNIFWRIFKRVYHDYLMEGRPFAISLFFKSGVFSLGSGFSEYIDKLTGPIEVDYLESCNWSVRKDLLDRIGGFDERFIGVGDYCEADAVYKIKRFGYKMVFAPEVNIRHMVSVSGAFGSRAHSYARSRNLILFYYKHIKPNTIDKALRFLIYLAFINSYFIYSFLKTAQCGHLSGIYGTIDGLIRYIPEFYSKNSIVQRGHLYEK